VVLSGFSPIGQTELLLQKSSPRDLGEDTAKSILLMTPVITAVESFRMNAK
jgi:hypothetical protein